MKETLKSSSILVRVSDLSFNDSGLCDLEAARKLALQLLNETSPYSQRSIVDVLEGYLDGKITTGDLRINRFTVHLFYLFFLNFLKVSEVNK